MIIIMSIIIFNEASLSHKLRTFWHNMAIWGSGMALHNIHKAWPISWSLPAYIQSQHWETRSKARSKIIYNIFGIVHLEVSEFLGCEPKGIAGGWWGRPGDQDIRRGATRLKGTITHAFYLQQISAKLGDWTIFGLGWIQRCLSATFNPYREWSNECMWCCGTLG